MNKYGRFWIIAQFFVVLWATAGVMLFVLMNLISFVPLSKQIEIISNEGTMRFFFSNLLSLLILSTIWNIPVFALLLFVRRKKIEQMYRFMKMALWIVPLIFFVLSVLCTTIHVYNYSE